MSRPAHRVAAQVAVEYVVNHGGDGFAIETMRDVLNVALAAGVAPLYTDMLREAIVNHPDVAQLPHPDVDMDVEQTVRDAHDATVAAVEALADEAEGEFTRAVQQLQTAANGLALLVVTW